MSMFRLFAIVAVAGAFFGALYFSGNALEAWESPKPMRKAAAVKPMAKKKAKARLVSREKPTAHRAKQPTTWLAKLNRLCRSSEEDAAAIAPPITAEGTSYYLREIVPVARRFNRRADVLLASAPDRSAAERMHRLFSSEERLLGSLADAIDDRNIDRMRQTMTTLMAVGKSENRILTRLGARGCTLSEDAFAVG
jgi:hypothetical protein